MDEKETDGQSETDKLLFELVVRQSALEIELIKAGVITEQGLSDSQLACMAKIASVLEARTEIPKHGDELPDGGFLKHGQ